MSRSKKEAMQGQTGTFPYGANKTEAPYSDGLISSAPIGAVPVEVNFPAFNTVGENQAKAGTVQPYIGGTTTIVCQQVWHPVLAGDF